MVLSQTNTILAGVVSNRNSESDDSNNLLDQLHWLTCSESTRPEALRVFEARATKAWKPSTLFITSSNVFSVHASSLSRSSRARTHAKP